MVGQEDSAHSASAPPHVREYLSIVCANARNRCAAQRSDDRHA